MKYYTPYAIIILAILGTLWTGYFIASSYFALKSTDGQIIQFINEQIQKAQPQ